MPASADVAVLVVTYNHGAEIDACLDGALAQAANGLTVEVVVVDNASSDDTRARVRARAASGVRLVAMDRNTGFAAATNAAFAATTADHVLILNPDCVMADGCARALLEHLEARPSVALAAALLHNLDGSPQRFARRDLGLRGVLWAYTSVGRRIDAGLRDGRALAARTYAELWEGGPPREPIAVFCPAAACVLAARGDLEPAPFDERFPLFFNDGDLCARLWAAGRAVEVVPAATAAHGYGTSVRRAQRSDPAAVRAEWVASMCRYAAKHWGRAARTALPVLLLADAAAGAALCLARRGDPREVRGTLGGLGLPGAPRPLLSRPLARGRAGAPGVPARRRAGGRTGTRRG